MYFNNHRSCASFLCIWVSLQIPLIVQKAATSAFRLHQDPSCSLGFFLFWSLFPVFPCILLLQNLSFPIAPKYFQYHQLLSEQDFDLGFLVLVAGKRGEVFLFMSPLLCACSILQDTSFLSCWSWLRPTLHSWQFIFNLLSRSSASEPLQSTHLLLLPILGSSVL